MPAQWVVKRQEFFSPTGTAKQAELNQICCKAGALSWRKVQTSNPVFFVVVKMDRGHKHMLSWVPEPPATSCSPLPRLTQACDSEDVNLT